MKLFGRGAASALAKWGPADLRTLSQRSSWLRPNWIAAKLTSQFATLKRKRLPMWTAISDHASTYWAITNLGRAYWLAGRLDKGIPILRRPATALVR